MSIFSRFSSIRRETSTNSIL